MEQKVWSEHCYSALKNRFGSQRWRHNSACKACSAMNERIRSNNIALITLCAIKEHTLHTLIRFPPLPISSSYRLILGICRENHSSHCPNFWGKFTTSSYHYQHLLLYILNPFWLIKFQCKNFTTPLTPDSDNILYTVIKHISLPLKEVLCKLFSKFLPTAIYHSSWNSLRILLLLKPSKDRVPTYSFSFMPKKTLWAYP